MVDIPADTVTQQDLYTWYELQQQLAKIKAAEMLLRRKIFDAFFPQPKEGVNKYVMEGGYVLQATYGYERALDVAAFDALLKEAKELKRKRKPLTFNPAALVRYDPKLVLKEYRGLTEEERAVFDACIVAKPGSPALKIVAPKADDAHSPDTVQE